MNNKGISYNDLFNGLEDELNKIRTQTEYEKQYKASRTKEDDIRDRINAMSLDEQAFLARALQTGNYKLSDSTKAAKEVYDKGTEQAKLIASQTGLKEGDKDYEDFIDAYRQQYYDQMIGAGVVSYRQAQEMDKVYLQTEADMMDAENKKWLQNQANTSSSGKKTNYSAGHVGADQWVNDFTNWGRSLSQNPRWLDMMNHLQTSGLAPYDTTKYSPSPNPYTQQKEYDTEFLNYYNNLPKE